MTEAPKRVTRSPCPVAGCTRIVVAKGLCLTHYKRQRAGKPLVDEGPQVGERSGYGLYGILTRDEHAVLCHECGQWFVSVAAHIGSAHGLSGRDYKRRHGLPARQPLISKQLSRAQSNAATARVGSPAWQHLEDARDPSAASRARTPDSFKRRGPDIATAAAIARDNGTPPPGPERRCVVCGNSVHGRRRTCSDRCLTTWRRSTALRQTEAHRRPLTQSETAQLITASLTDPGPLIRSLQVAGVYSTDIARALRVSPSWISTHYPLDPITRTEHRTRRKPPNR